jgi:hypothetical protein
MLGSVWLLIHGRIAALKAYQIAEIENFLIFAVLLSRSGGLISGSRKFGENRVCVQNLTGKKARTSQKN